MLGGREYLATSYILGNSLVAIGEARADPMAGPFGAKWSGDQRMLRRWVEARKGPRQSVAGQVDSERDVSRAVGAYADRAAASMSPQTKAQPKRWRGSLRNTTGFVGIYAHHNRLLWIGSGALLGRSASSAHSRSAPDSICGPVLISALSANFLSPNTRLQYVGIFALDCEAKTSPRTNWRQFGLAGSPAILLAATKSPTSEMSVCEGRAIYRREKDACWACPSWPCGQPWWWYRNQLQRRSTGLASRCNCSTYGEVTPA
jgi:hypothetical protein